MKKTAEKNTRLKKKNQKKFKHRSMKIADLNEVLALEKKCFSQAYSREILSQELKINAAHLWVLPYQKKMIAYLDFWVVADEIELVSIAVHPEYRRLGAGHYLLARMIAYGRRARVRSIYLDVRSSNEKAKALYKKLGFQTVGLRKRYYSDNQEDALILRKNL